MPVLEFTCQQCGREYGEGGFQVEGEGSSVAFYDVSLNCPQCGEFNAPALGSGPYVVRGGRLIRVGAIVGRLASSATVDEIVQLKRELEQAKANDNSELITAIRAEFTDLKRELREQHTKQDRQWLIDLVLALLIALIPYLMTVARDRDNSDNQVSPEQIEQIIDSVLEKQQPSPQATSPTPTRNATTAPSIPEPSRSAPCPCDSGRKYKRCCGPLKTPR